MYWACWPDSMGYTGLVLLPPGPWHTWQERALFWPSATLPTAKAGLERKSVKNSVNANLIILPVSSLVIIFLYSLTDRCLLQSLPR